MNFKVKDHYFLKAKKENFMARSVYKLEEINEKFSVIEKPQKVLDLGYFPGSWTQYLASTIHENAQIVGVDIQPINEALNEMENVTLFHKSIEDIDTCEDLGVKGRFDLVVSDMAPKTTGVKSVDQLRSLGLVELVFYKLPVFLRDGGNFVIKVFDSGEAQKFLKNQRHLFDKYNFFKPKSTRKISKEFFVVGKGFKNNCSR